MVQRILMICLCLSLYAGTSAAPNRRTEISCLRHTPLFAVGDIGFMGATSTPEKSLQALLGRPGATGCFVALLRTATLEGQLYALLGLRLTDRRIFLREEPHYLRMKRRVMWASADIVLSVPAGLVAKKIARGDYDARLMRD